MIEMRDKLAAWISGDGVSFNSDLLSSGSSIVSPAAEAQSALVALGYKAIEAEKAVKRVGGSDLTVEQIIREALRGMVKN
jgi:Holliday junction DNA helicase RuvA